MTDPELRDWRASCRGYRRSEITASIGHGEGVWTRAAEGVLRWGVKTASGFTVDPPGAVSPGDRVMVTVRLLVLTIREPVEVVSVVEESDRVGFAYRTMPGHPVSGEEAFIVHRDGGEVRLTVRSLTRPARSSRGEPCTRCCGSRNWSHDAAI